MKNKFFEKAYLMQDGELLATFHLVDTESFSLHYKYVAEEGFGDFRKELEESQKSEGQDKAYEELFKNVWLIDAKTSEVSRNFLIFINEEYAYVRPKIDPSTYELKKHDEILAKFSSCEDVANSRWWYVCKFRPGEGFAEYQDRFLEASKLLKSGENPQRVQEIYAQLTGEGIILFEKWRRGGGTRFSDFRLRFDEDEVYICTYGSPFEEVYEDDADEFYYDKNNSFLIRVFVSLLLFMLSPLIFILRRLK